jgi:hypothetical protein
MPPTGKGRRGRSLEPEVEEVIKDRGRAPETALWILTGGDMAAKV